MNHAMNMPSISTYIPMQFIPRVYYARIVGIHRNELLPIAEKLKEGDPVTLRFEHYPTYNRPIAITAANKDGERFGFMEEGWAKTYAPKEIQFPHLLKAYVDTVKTYKWKPGLSRIYIRFAYADDYEEGIPYLSIPYKKLFPR